MASWNNKFNGYYLTYNISMPLYTKIRKIIHKETFNVFNLLGTEVRAEPNMNAVLPIGIFSNKDMKLDCKKWSNTDRKFEIPMTSEIKSKIVLTEVQKEILKVFFTNCQDIQTNNLCPVYLNLVGECSIGKTVIALEIISIFKYKTLIITPSIDLAKQWGQSILKFIENSNYYVSTMGASYLLKNMKEIPDILLCPSKHLSNQDFIKFAIQNYSICFIDEQHTYNLETNQMMKNFFAFNSFPFVFSLTATPRSFNALYLGREINLEKLVEEFKPRLFIKESYEVVIPKYELIRYSDHYNKYLELCKKKTLSKDEVIFKSLLKKRCLSEDMNRSKAIINNINKTYEDDSKIIVLVHFVSEIDFIFNALTDPKDPLYIKDSNINKENVFKIYAASKNNEPTSLINVKNDIQNKNNYILIGTEDHLGTGIDVKELNILHLTSITTNKNNLIQYAGRVSRDNITPIHKLFYYNISSYPKINLEQNCKEIQKILKSKNWIIEKKMIF